MKLRTKISAAAVSLLLILSQGFAAWNLTQTKKRLLDTIIEAEASQLATDMYNFSKEYRKMQSYLLDERGICFWGENEFRSLYSENTVLYYNGKEISNRTPYVFDLNGKKGESVGGETRYPAGSTEMFREKLGGRMLFIFALTGNEGFQMVRYRDVTQVYEKSRELFLQGMVMAVLLSLLLMAALVLLLKQILKPFYRLRDAANVIAGGDYTKRVAPVGKDEVGEVAKSFNDMADRVQEHVQELADTNEKQRRLLGALSHELKTPLTGIQGYAELLQKVELSPERQMDALDYIRQECRRLSRLSAKMLQLVELSGEEQIEKSAVDGRELLEKAEEITRYRLRERRLRLIVSCEEEFTVEGDEDLLLSLLTNLIDNAAKASEPGALIRLTGSGRGIFVQDEGAGIAPEEIQRITEPFYMVDKSRARRQGGAGLGLALCAQIARLHGGKLVIRSEVGQGSTIGMQLS